MYCYDSECPVGERSPRDPYNPLKRNPAYVKNNGSQMPKAELTNQKDSDYCVRDLSLAEWGRKEISVAEQEMPGLMAVRAKYGPQKPLAGVRVVRFAAHDD